MAITIPELGTIKAFAMIVDINHFTRMVAEDHTGLIAQFVRDVLSGPIAAIERYDGEVVGYMGDAVLGVLPTGEGAAFACFDIAKDLDRQCEYISSRIFRRIGRSRAVVPQLRLPLSMVRSTFQRLAAAFLARIGYSSEMQSIMPAGSHREESATAATLARLRQ